MNLLLIAVSNLKKRKGAAVSLGILLMLAALMLSIGLNLMLNTSHFFTDKIEQLHAPHAVLVISENQYMPEFAEFFEEDARVSEVEVKNIIPMDIASTQFGTGSSKMGALFLNTEQEGRILSFEAIETAAVPPEEAIYLPVGIRAGAPALGEPMEFSYKNKMFRFWVAGYFETTVFGTSNTGAIHYYLDNAAFERLFDEVGGGKEICLRLKDPVQTAELIRDFKEDADRLLYTDPFYAYRFSYEDMLYVGEVMPGMFSMALIAFSAVLLLIAVLVARFRIVGNIQDNMCNIGALGVMGYTTGQIVCAFMMEFCMLALAGSLLGVLASHAAAPAIGGMLTGVAGVVWQGGDRVVSDTLCVLLVLAFVGAVCLSAIPRIRRIPPVVALRGGVETHSFRKNYFPLEKGGPLTIKLAGKYTVHSIRTGVMMAAIYGFVTVTILLSGVLYMNMVRDQTALMRMLGTEVSDVTVHTTRRADVEAFCEELRARPGVRKALAVDVENFSVDGLDVVGTVSDAYDSVETLSVYKGSMPRYANEIVITGVMAHTLHKGIGDEVEVQLGGLSDRYLITGLTQSTNMMGKVALLTGEGMRSLNPDYRGTTINLYLQEGVEVSAFIEQLKADYSVLSPGETAQDLTGYSAVKAMADEKMANLITMYGVDSVQYALMENGEIVVSGGSDSYKVERIQDFGAMLRAQTYSFGNLIGVLAQSVLLFSALIIGLILCLVLRAMIQRRQKELGIYMAMGYTTFQLMNQIAWSILPMAILGTVLGAAAGCVGTAPFFSMMFSAMGIGLTNVRFTVSPWLVGALCAGIIAYTYLISMLAARRIRKVSVYALLSD